MPRSRKLILVIAAAVLTSVSWLLLADGGRLDALLNTGNADAPETTVRLDGSQVVEADRNQPQWATGRKTSEDSADRGGGSGVDYQKSLSASTPATSDNATPPAPQQGGASGNSVEQLSQAEADRAAAEAAAEKAKVDTEIRSDAPVNITAPVSPRQAFRSRYGRRVGRQTLQGSKPQKTELAPPAEGSVPGPLEKPALRNGLYAEYYDLGNTALHTRLASSSDPLQGLSKTARIDATVDFPTRASFGIGDPNNFVVRWEGLLWMEQDSEIVLMLGNDNAGGLSIDGQAVIINEHFHYYIESYAIVSLTRGFHRLLVEHVEQYQGQDTQRASACRLAYKWRWEDASVSAIPAEWLYQPEAVGAKAPEITRVTPAEITIGAQFAIEGKRFKAGAGEENIADSMGITGSAGGLEVYVDGIPASIVSATDTRIVALHPAGAGSGRVEVRRRGLPSNGAQITVNDAFGLVISVWDLTGYAEDFVDPESRVPDFALLDPNPFPLTRDKFPQFNGKAICVRVEGQVALPESFVVFSVNGSGPASLEEQPVKLSPLQKVVAYPLSSWVGVVSGKRSEVSLGPFGTPLQSMSLVGDNAQFALFPATGVEQSVSASGLGMSWWVGFSAQMVLESESTGTLVDVHTIHASKSRQPSHFRPNFVPPPPPVVVSLHENSSAKVGEEVVVYIDEASTKVQGQALGFTVDGVVTTGRAITTFKEQPVGPLQQTMEGITRSMLPFAVVIPDGAGRGEVRGRIGISQSAEPALIDITDRGLRAFYYDFDTPLVASPDVSSKVPVFTRRDRQLNFLNNTDFDLTFPAERFSVEWYGQIRIPAEGEWRFRVRSDDGYNIRIGDTVIGSFQGLRPPSDSVHKVTLPAGWHDLYIDFYENDVNEAFVLSWQQPGSSGFEVVPAKHYRPERIRGIPDKQSLHGERSAK